MSNKAQNGPKGPKDKKMARQSVTNLSSSDLGLTYKIVTGEHGGKTHRILVFIDDNKNVCTTGLSESPPAAMNAAAKRVSGFLPKEGDVVNPLEAAQKLLATMTPEQLEAFKASL